MTPEARQHARPAVAAQASDESRRLAEALDLPEPVARLLISRGIGSETAARAFLTPTLAQLHDPLQMLGLPVALSRLQAALAAEEPILIYGDYDVDGTVATVLLKTATERAARAMGRRADVRYHIPHRLREGYGLREARLAEAAEEGVRLVISVDTGVRAFAAAEEAERLGLDLIVTDHHLPDALRGVPRALAVVNPNQPGCPYPYKSLCGAAVAFKLAQALLESSCEDAAARDRLHRKTLPSFLKLLAIATVADAVPLTGENRVIAAIGLAELRQPAQPGLRALMELAGIVPERGVTATDVGFRLAPRINAAGRMDVADDVVRLFLTQDAVEGRQLAEKLYVLNEERRGVEAIALREIEAMLEGMAASRETLAGCLVLDDAMSGGAGWHRGVVGILASRVVERTGRPALVLAHEEGEAHGSGRSVAGFHLLEALTEAHAEDGLFSRFGGHAHAVGFALPSERVAELRARMERLAAVHAQETEEVTALPCDAEVRLRELTPLFLGALAQLGPWGHGHEEPLFLTRGARLCAPVRPFGERHLRLSLEDAEDGRRFNGVAWGRRTNWAERAREEAWAAGDRLDVAYRLRRNWHPDFGGWELEVVELWRREKDVPEPSCTVV